MVKLTIEKFIERANKVHNYKYDYSLIKYKNIFTNIKIICPIHGEFKQIPHKHLQKHGCQKCGAIRKTKDTTEGFIKKAKEIHGDKYDYSLVEYINRSTKVKIICKVHGMFEQMPQSHLITRSGCYKCGRIASGKKLSKSSGEFINKIIKVHGNVYDYSLVDYKNAESIIKIICKIHGVFQQKAKTHREGHGCQKCYAFKSKGEEKIRKFLQKNNILFEEQKTFNECKNKIKLRFDFYLPKHNALIEYDGIQHYKPINSWGGKIRFKEIIKSDKIKNEFAKQNHIKLLRIKYTIKDIDMRLNKIIGGLK
jgi:protein-arginine kinase activator protein McsA